MTSFSEYAARLREFIRWNPPAPGRSPWISEDRDEAFNDLALDLFHLHFQSVQPFRRLCEARSVSPASIRRWVEIPALPAAAFKEAGVTSLSASERTTVFQSSGTTEGKRSRQFHNAESFQLYEASLLPPFRFHLLPDAPEKLRLISLTPSPALAPHSSLVHMFETVRREFGAPDSFFAGETDAGGSWTLRTEELIDAFRSATLNGRRLVLLGTAFNFVHLADRLAERHLRFNLPPGSRLLETGGYKGRSRSLPGIELHALITEHLGVPPSCIVCEYGMSELSSQAYDSVAEPDSSALTAGERVFRFPAWARAQIISPETGLETGAGEAGLIRVFDLANLRSVLAMQTEDLAVRRGDGFALLGRAHQAEPRGCSLMAAE